MPLPETVDTVVVGAGAGGCVVASRLTEDPDRDVLLLDAGPDYPDPATLPSDLADARRNSMVRHDWGYRHRPNHARRLRFPFPRGRVVGGSSAVNTCIALRGQPGDYDAWAARGLSEWSWDQCLPAFRMLENDLDTWTDDRWHGRSGPLPLRRDPRSAWTRWHGAFVDAALGLGFPDCPDTNVPGAEGVGAHAMNRLDGRRISAAEAWLTPAVRARPHLRIAGDATVLRVVTRGTRAVGVDVLRHGVVHRIAANRVVLASGAIATPEVLLRSGIGPRHVLHAHRIPVVRDLPGVGAQLLDHPGSAIFFLPRPGVATPRDPMIQTVLRYRAPGETVPATAQLQSGGAMPFESPVTFLFSVMASVGRPKGTGRIHWPSLVPGARPVLDSRLYDHPDDRRHGVEMMQLAWELAHQPAMRDLARPLWPRPRTMASRSAIDAWIRRSTDSGYHPCGTVPMGTDDDPNAACDGRGRVRGVNGLVVADASLFPEIMTANTHLPTLMVAERIAGWLRAEA